jgi:septal ring factor EnvC (AmiA/AmiB activator)
LDLCCRNTDLKLLHELAVQLVRLQAITRAQNYLLHVVSQIPPSESPLNTLLTRDAIEKVNDQTLKTQSQVRSEIAEVSARVERERALLEESLEISEALKERLSSLRSKAQQTSAQYLAYFSLLALLT